MREYELTFDADGPEAFATCLSNLGLTFDRLPVKGLPHAIHWHITKKSSRGTLEATWDPFSQRFWVSTRANRYAPWQDEVIAAISAAINKP